MQRALEARRNTLSEQLQKKQLDFSTQLQKNIDDYLATYNKDGKYDYILSYSRSGSILFANKALDITDDVLKGLNETAPKADTSKKAK
jgi:outer membrane protein